MICIMITSLDIARLRKLSAAELLGWTRNNFGKDTVMTSSFGAEDMVIIDLLSRNNIEIGIATIDTGRLPEETYDLMERASDKYGIPIQLYFPDYTEVERMVSDMGMNLFYRSIEKRKLCCNIRKVEPLNRLLRGKKAWVTGLRADQTAFRKNAEIVEHDTQRQLVKINPLLNWSSVDVWDYIRKNDVPYNSLHDRGYPSIGCAPCTRAVEPGEDERAGRWWWESDVKECGLHVTHDTKPGTPEMLISKKAGD